MFAPKKPPVGLILQQLRRRWANIIPTQAHYLVFTGTGARQRGHSVRTYHLFPGVLRHQVRTRHWTNGVLMLAQRLQRWDNNKPTLFLCLDFAVSAPPPLHSITCSERNRGELSVFRSRLSRQTTTCQSECWLMLAGEHCWTKVGKNHRIRIDIVLW